MRLSFGSAPDAHLDTELLSSYLDNQIAPQERLRVEQHLRTCSACQTEFNSLHQTVSLLQALPRVPVPRPFTLSEAQVGARRRTGGAWYWGAARALGAAAALVLVAVVVVELLQRQGQLNTGQIARLPSAAPAASQPAAAPVPSVQQPAAPLAPAPLTSAPLAATAATQRSAQTEAAPNQAAAPRPPTQAARAVVPTNTARVAQDRVAPAGKATIPAAPTRAPAAAAKAASPAATAGKQAATPGTTASAGGSASAGRPAAPTNSPEAPALAMAPPASPSPGLEQGPMALSAQSGPASSTAPAGRGGGGGGPASPSQQPAVPLPPPAPLDQALPGSAGLVYTDHQTIKSIDSRGQHELVEAPGAAAPLIAPDRSWVAYRTQSGENSSVWAVRWNGANAHVVADGGEYPSHDHSSTGPVQIETMQWLPSGHTLALIVAIPDPNGTGEPRRELWTASPEGKDLRFVAELGLSGSASFSPDGRTVAVLQRGAPTQPQGRLYLASTEGGSERLALEFPANANGYGYDSQISWQPDSSTLWVAIPEPNAVFPDGGKLNLYRVTIDGQAEQAGQLQGNDTYWSPDGKHLAYTRPIAGNVSNRELVLANPDGNNAQVYAPVAAGGFGKWSPDGRAFIYYTDDQWYLGGPGQPPQPIGGISSIAEPHWTGSGQLLYLTDDGANWALVSRAANGKTATLATIPKEAEVTMTGR